MAFRFLLSLILIATESSVGLASPSLDQPSFINEGIVQAPLADVWRIWSTAEGWKALGPAKVDLDLRLGGLIRSHYKPEGVLGDEGTIQNRILAYEPPRMLAICIDQPPKDFPFKQAWRNTWTVISLEAVDDTRTHVRIASLGFGADEESQAMHRFFESGNRWTIEKLKAHFGGEPPAGDAHGSSR